MHAFTSEGGQAIRDTMHIQKRLLEGMYVTDEAISTSAGRVLPDLGKALIKMLAGQGVKEMGDVERKFREFEEAVRQAIKAAQGRLAPAEGL